MVLEKPPHRLLLASCPYEITQDLGLFAAVTLKSCSLEPIHGPCLFNEVAPDTFMNRWGLDNPGLPSVLKYTLPRVQAFQPNVILSALFSRESEIRPFLEQIVNHRLAGVELNISCPNTQVFDLILPIVSEAREILGTSVSLGLKIGPDFPIEVVQALEVDFLTFSNTIPTYYDGFGPGGLSGAPLRKAVFLRLEEIRRAFQGVLIACGGVKTASDYSSYLNLGADYVAIASQYLKNKDVVFDILSEVE